MEKYKKKTISQIQALAVKKITMNKFKIDLKKQ